MIDNNSNKDGLHLILSSWSMSISCNLNEDSMGCKVFIARIVFYQELEAK